MTVTENEADAIVREMNVLAERMCEMGCQSVQIIATAMLRGLEGDNTLILKKGAGNSFASTGAVRHWLENDSARDLASELADALAEGDDFDAD